MRSLVVTVYLPALLFAVGQGAVIPVVALTATDLGATAAMATVVVALRGIGTMVFDVPAGSLVGRIGERRAMAAATALLAVALVGCILSPNAYVFAACMFVMGCGWAVWLLARLSYVSEVMPMHLRGRALSTLGGVQRIGNFIGPLVGAGAIALGGLDGAYLVHIVLAVAGWLVLVSVPDPHATSVPPHAHLPVAQVVRSHRHVFATAGVAAACLGVLRVSRIAIVPLWGERIGLDAAQVSLIFSFSSAVDMTLFYPVGLASDRFGRRAVAVPCLVLLALGFAWVPFTDSVATLAAAGVLMGIGNGLGSGIVMTLGADYAPPGARASFLGVWRLVSDVGQAGGPLVAAATIGLVGLGASSGVVAALGVAGAGIFLVALPPAHDDPEQAERT
ncbi:MFS transporter [Actinomarinicola tropica]|uniref:MFS transporter n=1 Tax=Actinomarinicola tropica TaxID=2789776 RepID=A0A5Q2RMF5_9ACTN|nr:MFS transporter [Actinomarinicola tropica]